MYVRTKPNQTKRKIIFIIIILLLIIIIKIYRQKIIIKNNEIIKNKFKLLKNLHTQTYISIYILHI